MNLSALDNDLMQNPEYLAEYRQRALALAIARLIVRARVQRGMTQAQLAELVGTKQPSIARLERGLRLPSLFFLSQIANALSVDLSSLIPHQPKLDSVTPTDRLMKPA